MKVHKVRQVLGSAVGEVLQAQQQAEVEKRAKGVAKPLGSALLHGLLRRPGGLGKEGGKS